MKTIKILHTVLKGMDAYISCGVPEPYWILAVNLTNEIYGEAGVELLEKYHKTYDDSVDARHETILHSINGWDDPNTEIGPKELIKKLKALSKKAKKRRVKV